MTGGQIEAITLIVMLITNNRRIMLQWTNQLAINVLGWLMAAAMFAATIGLVLTLLK